MKKKEYENEMKGAPTKLSEKGAFTMRKGHLGGPTKLNQGPENI